MVGGLVSFDCLLVWMCFVVWNVFVCEVWLVVACYVLLMLCCTGFVGLYWLSGLLFMFDSKLFVSWWRLCCLF